MEQVHWFRTSPFKNAYPEENADGRAPIFNTADFVMWDVGRWRAAVPEEYMAPVPAGDLRVTRGTRLIDLRH